MKLALYLYTILALAASCNPKGGGNTLSGCYRMIVQSDTATLSLNQDGNLVTGSLTYNWKERDDNVGTFKGTLKNDSLIVAEYTFQSEGLTSVRQVVFKVRDSLLLQGYGELIVRNDSSFFRDVNLVIFDTKHPFRKGCE